MVREFTQKCLDPLVGGDRFDFVKDLGSVMPLRVVGMLFGIPEDYQRRVQEDGERYVRTERGGQATDNPDGVITDGEVFADFIDWRVDHPVDDLTTELLNAEFEDETGTTRKLRRDELLMFMNVVAVAGSKPPPGSSDSRASCCPNTRISADSWSPTGRCCRVRSRRSCGSSRLLCRPRVT